jgi:hypothetical protein
MPELLISRCSWPLAQLPENMPMARKLKTKQPLDYLATHPAATV